MPIPRRSLTLIAPGQGELFAGIPKDELFRYGQSQDGRTPPSLRLSPAQMALPFEERPDLSRHVTSAINKKTPFHRWYNFPHSFSHELVRSLLTEWGVRSGDTVLDPFCGAGTTLLAAKTMGISAVGIDRLPLAVFSTNAKLAEVDVPRFRDQWRQLRAAPFSSERALPQGMPYLRKAFTASVLLQLSAWKRRIANVPDAFARNFFLLALLSVSAQVSQFSKDGAFLRRVTRRDRRPVEELLDNRVDAMLHDAAEHPAEGGQGAAGEWRAWEGDARALPIPDSTIAGTITSPPYLNKHDYTRVFRPELEFAFAESAEEVRRLRKTFLRSHVETLPLFHDAAYEPPPLLERLLAHVRRTPATTNRVLSVLRGYFEDMHLVLRELHRVSRDGARAALVIGSACYDGVLFPVDVLLAEVGMRVGWRLERIMVARHRNNSPQQMGRFGRQAAREGLVVLQKSAVPTGAAS